MRKFLATMALFSFGITGLQANQWWPEAGSFDLGGGYRRDRLHCERSIVTKKNDVQRKINLESYEVDNGTTSNPIRSTVTVNMSTVIIYTCVVMQIMDGLQMDSRWILISHACLLT